MPWRDGLTVRDVLKEIGYDIPGIFVLVNRQKIRRERWDDFSIPDGSEVDVHRIAAGG
jgi:thiamine biosynthesis protein ThiS